MCCSTLAVFAHRSVNVQDETLITNEDPVEKGFDNGLYHSAQHGRRGMTARLVTSSCPHYRPAGMSIASLQSVTCVQMKQCFFYPASHD